MMEKNKMFTFTELVIFLLWSVSLGFMVSTWFNYKMTTFEYCWLGLLAFFNGFVLIQPIIEWFKAGKRQKELILDDKKKKSSKKKNV